MFSEKHCSTQRAPLRYELTPEATRAAQAQSAWTWLDAERQHFSLTGVADALDKHRSSFPIVFAGVLTALLALPPGGAQAQPADPNIVVTLAGFGVPVDTPVFPGVDPIPGDCFKTNLFNTHTNVLIGTGIDCIFIADSDIADFSVNRTTIFHFPQGILVADGLTTVVPIFGASSPDFTHVVGDADPGTANIIFGTGRFRGATGDVRLSGIVNLEFFTTTGVEFNCTFVIDLD